VKGAGLFLLLGGSLAAQEVLEPGRTIELRLTAADPGLADLGPSRTFVHRVRLAGRVKVFPHVLAWSTETDAALRVAGGEGPERIEASRQSRYQFLRRECREDADLSVTVAAQAPGRVFLRVADAGETGQTLEAVRNARGGLDRVEAWSRAGRQAEAGVELQRLVERLLAVEDADASLRVYETLRSLGARARLLGHRGPAGAAYEGVVRFADRFFPEDHADALLARRLLADHHYQCGDFARARSLAEAALATLSRVPTPGDEAKLSWEEQLSAILTSLGDLPAARASQERIVRALEARRAPDDPVLLQARLHLSTILLRQGQRAEARELQERLLEICVHSSRSDRAPLLAVKAGLGDTLAELGELDRALAVKREVMEERLRQLPGNHPVLQADRMMLARTLLGAGDPRAARPLLEDALRIADRLESPISPQRAGLLHDLAWTLAELGDRAELPRVLESLARSTRERLLHYERSSDPRGIAAQAVSASAEIAAVLTLAPPLEPLRAEAFSLVETARAIGFERHRLAALERRGDAGLRREIDDLRAEVRRLDREVEARLGAGPDELLDAVRRREAARERLRAAHARLPGAAEELGPATVGRVARSLGPGEAAAGYWRHARSHRDPTDRGYLALVVRPDGSLAWVDLGAAAAIESAARAWLRPGHEAGDARSGETLRRLVLDPVRAAAGDAKRLWMALDEALHGVPLDALPAKEGPGVVGDALEIVRVPALRVLGAEAGPALREPTLLACGGIDYGAGRLAPLPETLGEVQGVAASFRAAFPDAPPSVPLAGGDARKPAFVSRVPGARFLHVATHGWFAESSPPAASREVLAGFLPMALCGLAFAGANAEGGAGVLTAEELAGLPLGDCELAVLSACETGLGLSRPGQGLASLQHALHVAGTRTSVAALWRVPDAPTRELMRGLYRRVWEERLPKARALWEAKRELRTRRDPGGDPLYTPRDWAGWSLVGQP
jgi:CHAT domain-containing protein/tetratricopeptide (TPR) repeat protein